MAYEAWSKVDARKSRPLNGEVRDLLVVEAQVQCHRLETWPAAAEFPEARDVVGLDQLEAGEALQRVIDIFDLLRYQLELVCREVFREYPAHTVEDEPANRRYGLDSDSIALRPFREVLVVDDLQLHQAHDDDAEQHKRKHARQDDASDKKPPFGVVVLDGRKQVHFRSPSVPDSARLSGTSTILAR